MRTIAANATRVKPASQLAAESENSGLSRKMGLWSLTAMSIGATVGSSVFVILGEAVPAAGPAVIMSFILVALVAALSALAYAELAGMIPSSGSSYSYAYASMGEMAAWLVGWMLFLMYGVSVAAMAVPWGEYVQDFLNRTVGWTIPEMLSNGPADGGIVNLPALTVVALAGLLLLRGSKESAFANNLLVAMKLLVLAMFAAFSFTEFSAGHFESFAPLGMTGIAAGASTLMFAYLGFDAASTAGEEAINAKRDLPRAIILSMIVVTAVYVTIALAAVGVLAWTEFEGQEAVMAHILSLVTGSAIWPALLSLVAVVSIFSVIFVVTYGQTRITFAMSRDGLLPAALSTTNSRGVPVANTVLTVVIIGGMAAFLPFGPLLDAVNLGTFLVFGSVSAAVLILRYTNRGRNLERGYKVPFGPALPVLSLLGLGYLMAQESVTALTHFGGYTLVGVLIYFAYGMRRSALAKSAAIEADLEADLAALALENQTKA